MEIYAIKYTRKDNGFNFLGAWLYKSLYEVETYMQEEKNNPVYTLTIVKLKVIE